MLACKKLARVSPTFKSHIIIHSVRTINLFFLVCDAGIQFLRSVRQFETLRYYAKKAKHIVEIISPSAIVLVFCHITKLRYKIAT